MVTTTKTQSLTRKLYHEHVLKNLPKPFKAFAYGSPIITKNSHSKMLDYIIVTDNAKEFHEKNMDMNPKHYSRIARVLLGANYLQRVSDFVGCGVHFNAFVEIESPDKNEFEQEMYKYGVVERVSLRRDLESWKDLYIAGRMQKPYEIVCSGDQGSDKDEIIDNEKNKRAALAYALLSLHDVKNNNEEVNERKIYETIANLSYEGDVRHIFGAEDSRKAEKIVEQSFDMMRTWYDESFRDFRDSLKVVDYEDGRSDEVIKRVVSPHSTRKLLAMLPQPFLETMVNGDLRELDMMSREANQETIAKSIRLASRNIVRKSSFRQTFLALMMNDFDKAFSYAAQKFRK
jgi:hypothetical protein